MAFYPAVCNSSKKHVESGELCLLGDFVFHVNDETVSLPLSEQRLLAFLACFGRVSSRPAIASSLWPDADPVRAQASLRTRLWRIKRVCQGAIHAVGGGLQLGPTIRVDVHRSGQVARDILAGEMVLTHPASGFIRQLSQDVLPHWYDEWLEPYRNQYGQLRVRALEEASRRLLDVDKPAAAVACAAEAVTAEPLRDSAQIALIRALVAEGNRSKAIEQYQRYSRLLRSELGVPAPMTFPEILHGLGRRSHQSQIRCRH